MLEVSSLEFFRESRFGCPFLAFLELFLNLLQLDQQLPVSLFYHLGLQHQFQLLILFIKHDVLLLEIRVALLLKLHLVRQLVQSLPQYSVVFDDLVKVPLPLG